MSPCRCPETRSRFLASLARASLTLALTLAYPAALGAMDVLHPEPPRLTDRPEVQAFLQAMVAKHAFQAGTLSSLLDGVQPSAAAIELVKPPPATGRRSWRVYRSRFVEPQRIRAGVAFWREHAATLARAERETGVAAEIIVGILGVETIFGRGMGRFPVLDVLATLAFDYPDTPSRSKRSALFLQELEEYLLWCRDTGQDPQSFSGSYTGAIGIPQFLPSSIRAYAVDYDGDGRIDLRGSAVDAIGSVASYLKAHGWEPARPALWRLAPSRKVQAASAAMADGDPEPKLRMGDLLAAGLRPQSLGPRQLRTFRKAERDTAVLLVDLPSPDRPTEYRIGLRNFYVITRYNRSFFYASAVVDLGSAVKRAMARK
jgi:membrane-bound lytic murein transglycosylase B